MQLFDKDKCLRKTIVYFGWDDTNLETALMNSIFGMKFVIRIPQIALICIIWLKLWFLGHAHAWPLLLCGKAFDFHAVSPGSISRQVTNNTSFGWALD